MFRPGVLRARCASASFCIMLLVLNPLSHAQSPLTITPLPSSATARSGELSLDHGLQITFEGYREPRLDRAKARFLLTLSRETGILEAPVAHAAPAGLTIKTSGPSAEIQQPNEDESYHLEVSTTGALLTAPNPLGVLHGLQTLLQLVQTTPSGFAIHALTIDDRPRFPWRGLMIDSSRHFIPLNVIRQNLDGMEAVKMNVFHWHLTDNQGFRVESKAFPLLQEKGSDGLFYTQDEVRETIQYARDRGIRVIPEFDMPGHTTAWFVGYPDLASAPGPYEIERHWGVFDPAMDPTRESTYKFLDKLIGEMTALFPDAYFHIGGDECNGKQWDANPQIQQFMKSHKIADDAALQAYFTARVQKIVTSHHKITVGWDEVLQPDTPHDVVIQSWRGADSLADAARRGYRGLLSAGYYIDLNHPAAEHYAADPLSNAASGLTQEQKANILGGEATMWSEYVSPETINSRIWPRTAAIAERLWSPQSVTDVDSMYRRIDLLAQKLAYYNLPYLGTREQMLKRLSGYSDPTPLTTLASIVQPPRDYVRGTLRSYDAFTPLNRLIDTVPPESDRAREFNELAAAIASGKANANDWSSARQWLTLWQVNDAALEPTLKNSDLTAELVPLSRNVSRTAAIGLEALNALQSHKSIDASSKKNLLAELGDLKKPQAVLLNAFNPGVELIVAAIPVQ